MIEQAGFTNLYVRPGIDVFSGAPAASSAASFGTHGVHIRAFKPE